MIYNINNTFLFYYFNANSRTLRFLNNSLLNFLHNVRKAVITFSLTYDIVSELKKVGFVHTYLLHLTP